MNTVFGSSWDEAFLFGEGVHGWSSTEAVRYTDDLRLQEAMARRWIDTYPSMDGHAWYAVQVVSPDEWPASQNSGGSSAFHHPRLVIQFFRVAGDSMDNGRIIAYRH